MRGAVGGGREVEVRGGACLGIGGNNSLFQEQVVLLRSPELCFPPGRPLFSAVLWGEDGLAPDQQRQGLPGRK